MKITAVCHGNIARSQILHHYMAHYADKASLSLELFSCGTAPVEAYPDAAILLADVQAELRKRGLNATVKRDVLDEKSLPHLLASDLILVADRNRRQDVLARLGDPAHSQKVMLFYEYIGEGERDFTDTYDAKKGAQDPVRFAKCFDELERIAKAVVGKIQKTMSMPPRR